MEIRRGLSLQSLNTLALPGAAEHFCRVDSLAALESALAHARRHRLPVSVLGGGSNLVLAGDVAGLVIQMGITGIAVIADAGERVRIRVGAGENWHGLVEHCLAQGWYGLENLALIPGSVGAAPVQNIGAYGVELSQVFVALDAVDIATGAIRQFDRAACQFGYRDSVFKNAERDTHIITALTLELCRTPQLHLDYPSLQRALAGTPAAAVTPQLVATAVCALRRHSLPDPAALPNAGSFFKNPVVTAATAAALRAQWPDLVAYPQPDGRLKLAAGWLIDRAGWRGARRDGAGVHCAQALVLVNHGCDGRSLLALAAAIQADILSKFGVALELEPRVLGGPAHGPAEADCGAGNPPAGCPRADRE